MADKINTKIVKGYQQKANPEKLRDNRYQQEAAEELTKANKSLQKAATKAQQKTNQYQQETASEFPTVDKAATANRTGYLMPDFNQEAAIENSVDRIMKTGKKDSKKNS